MALNSHDMRVPPPPVPDDVKRAVADEAETAAAGVHVAGQEPGYLAQQSRASSTPQGPEVKSKTQDRDGDGGEAGKESNAAKEA